PEQLRGLRQIVPEEQNAAQLGGGRGPCPPTRLLSHGLLKAEYRQVGVPSLEMVLCSRRTPCLQCGRIIGRCRTSRFVGELRRGGWCAAGQRGLGGQIESRGQFPARTV